MRKKNLVPFSQKFPNVDPLALRLLQRLLAFDPKDRPTAAEALADPYFKGLAKVEREPSCQPISKMEFEFERRRLTKDDIRELIYREILEYHPQLLKDYLNGSEGSNFLYPSAIGHLRKQFAYLEENSGKSGPVTPPERKHASLPRSTVHSSASANSTKPLGPPPKVPSGRPGRAVESYVNYENNRNLKESSYDARTSYYRSTVLPQQTVSPNGYFHPNAMNQEKRGVTEAASQPKPQFVVPAQCNSVKAAAELNPNPYVQSQHKVGIDAKLLQAQSQYGPVGAAAVAVAAHRSIGTVGYGMS
jgi:serine/threonine protein kinase